MAEVLPKCRICGFEGAWLGEHLSTAHKISVGTYLTLFPGSPTIHPDVLSEMESPLLQRSHPPALKDLRVDILGFPVPVNVAVPAEACLPLPSEYRFPVHGDLALDMQEALIALLSGRHTYIHGLPGTGKDAFIHALSWMIRKPAILRAVGPQTDVEAWLYTRSFDHQGTKWELGELFLALTEGYTCSSSGQKIPYLVLITDFDRATKSQAEILRLIIDSISGRVQGPMGKVYNVFPGTQIVVTANTSGGGDARGRMVSANVIDASILDRFERKIEFHWMEWADEGPICMAKFPLLQEKCPTIFPQVGQATRSLRAAIRAEKLYAEFSHRAVCSWLGHCEDIIRLTGKVPSDLAKRGARVWFDGLPDDQTRDEARRLVDPHLRNGAF